MKEHLEAKEERKNVYTREYIKECFEKTLKELPERYFEDAVTLLHENNACFAQTAYHCRIGCVTYYVKAIVPESFSLHVASRHVSGLQKLINAKNSLGSICDKNPIANFKKNRIASNVEQKVVKDLLDIWNIVDVEKGGILNVKVSWQRPPFYRNLLRQIMLPR